jgi:predicted lipoprotein with Yx(FWY)xxD motif
MKRKLLLALPAALLLSGGVVLSDSVAGPGRATSPAVVKAAYNKKLKTPILVDSRGFTLYVFALDSAGKPTCTDDSALHCIRAWPALKTTGTPRAAPGVKSSLLGVVKRPDGGVQVTYSHHPLYLYHGGGGYWGAGDKKPGDTKGQNWGAAWYAITPSGTVLRP